MENAAAGISMNTASRRASKNWPRPPDVVISNQASTISKVAVAVAGNWTR